MSDSASSSLLPSLLIVTGLAGAGMSSALKHLEDLGYEVFDNFPLTLVDALVRDPGRDARRPMAIGIDTRARGFAPEALMDVISRVRASLVFMSADEAALQKRFTETRRRHPMASDRSAADGIVREAELLFGLRSEADFVIDTTDFSTHDLRGHLEKLFGQEKSGLHITLMSFGFRHGLPRHADMVMDVRFLKNPHWDAVLKPQTGLIPAVREYVASDPAWSGFIENYKTLLTPLLPAYTAEGKNYLTIAIGCTGGRHRSVSVVEVLKDWFAQQGYTPDIQHRDLNK